MLGYIFVIEGKLQGQDFDHELNGGVLQTFGWGTVMILYLPVSSIYLAY